MVLTLWARLLTFVAVATSVFVLLPGALARADSGDPIGIPALTQPFLPWLDASFYAPVPGGSFEPGEASWQLTGPASIVADNEPWHVDGPGGYALSLHRGASAVSPPFAVDPLTPTVRFFVRSTSLLPSVATASVVIDTGSGTLTLPIGVVTATFGWQPSLPLPLLANATSVLGGSFGSAQLEVTALVGDMRVDDVYVDPFKTS